MSSATQPFDLERAYRDLAERHSATVHRLKTYESALNQLKADHDRAMQVKDELIEELKTKLKCFEDGMSLSRAGTAGADRPVSASDYTSYQSK